MAEEAVVTADVADAVETPVADTPAALGSFVNPDGTLKDGWKDALVPEDFRGRRVYDTFRTLPDLMKQLGHQDSLIGRQGKGIIPPGEKATKTEWDMYFKSLGRPDTPDAYEFTPPPELAPFYDAETLGKARAAMHEAGLTPQQFSKIMALDAQRVQAAMAAKEQAETEARGAAETALKAKWGAAYEARLHLANRVIADTVQDDAMKAELLSRIGNDPVVADFLASIGTKFMEHGHIEPDGGSDAMTPGAAENRMKELISEQTREPDMRTRNPAKFERLNAEIRRLAAMSLQGSK